MSAAKESIIDFRLRPAPVDEFKPMFPHESTLRYHNACGSQPSPSFMQQSVDLLFKEMDQLGIKLGVMNGRHTKGLNVEDDKLAAVQQRFPTRFIALAGTDFTKPMNEIVQGIEHGVRKLGLIGVTVEPQLAPTPMHVDDERLFPIYEKCIELDVFVQLMSGPMAGPDLTHTDPVYYERLAMKYPDMKMVLAHGCYPYITEVVALVARGRRIGKPNVYVSPDCYVFMPGGSVYVEAINAYPDNFIYGSAYPFGAIENAEKTMKLPLDAKARSKYMYETAAKLLKL